MPPPPLSYTRIPRSDSPDNKYDLLRIDARYRHKGVKKERRGGEGGGGGEEKRNETSKNTTAFTVIVQLHLYAICPRLLSVCLNGASIFHHSPCNLCTITFSSIIFLCRVKENARSQTLNKQLGHALL